MCWVLGIKMTTACPCPPRAYRLVVLIMNNPSSYYVGASGYELRQRGEGKVQLLECPHLAAPARELPGTAVQAQLSGLSPSLLPACPSSGESSKPHGARATASCLSSKTKGEGSAYLSGMYFSGDFNLPLMSNLKHEEERIRKNIGQCQRCL